MSLVTVSGSRCNRCRKHLKAMSSIIRGVGPVCARNILKRLAFGLRGHARHKFLNEVFAPEVNAGVLTAYDDIIVALQADGCSMDVDHRGPFSELLAKGSRIKVVEYVLVIFADICNQLSQSIKAAEATRSFFIVLGLGDEEADKAYNRLVKLAKKVSTF